MSDFFRISKGVEIDGSLRIFTSEGPPGYTADTDASLIGSMYTDNRTGLFYVKQSNTTGSTSWTLVPFMIPANMLYDENVSSESLPVAHGTNSIALGEGAQTATTGTNSLAIGNQSLSRIPGGVVQANGNFGSIGDAQIGTYLLRTITTNTTETEMFIDGVGGSQQLILLDNSTWTFTATITGHRTDTVNGHAGYKIEGVVYRGVGVATTTILGNPVLTVLSETNNEWEIRVYADTTIGALAFTCIGQSGKTIRWLAKIETVEVTD